MRHVLAAVFFFVFCRDMHHDIAWVDMLCFFGIVICTAMDGILCFFRRANSVFLGPFYKENEIQVQTSEQPKVDGENWGTCMRGPPKGDVPFLARQGLFWPYYPCFSVGGRSVEGSSRGQLASLDASRPLLALLC